jgi:exodeoxyribonuclease V beta subunit
MTDINNFDLLNSTLEGTNLIEASAGTGKTYTITGLFLRLVLEKHLSVSRILVVTFTEAATGELKERIRNHLREAIRAFSEGGSQDPFLMDLSNKMNDAEKALTHLKEALREFDQASIFTIHGFCKRMLQENAFESGSLFDTELVTDQENLKREIVDDFWRKNFYRASPLFVHYAMDNKLSPDALLSLIGNRVAQPYLKVIPRVDTPDATREEAAYKESFEEVRKTWYSAKQEVEQILVSDKGLSRTKYGKGKIPDWIRGMDFYMASGENHCLPFKGFEKFTSTVLKGAVKKNHVSPAHPFFEQCERLKAKQEALEKIFNRRLLGLKRKLFTYMEQALFERKEKKNIQSFDDLLLKLQTALRGKGGDRLSKVMGMRYRAVLIDEFQDTDPIQYDIFKRVFGSEDHALFLIGDPKQAIYGFRGADIFTYKEAAGDVGARYTLGENWRSSPDLITAINTLFGSTHKPFVYDHIPFHPARPARRRESELLKINGKDEAPFQLWFIEGEGAGESGKAVTKTKARELIPKAVAGEIAQLLELGRNNKARIGENPLKESDIAVLVRRNSEARLMQEALSVFHIQSVLFSTDNLFDSHEALEMERVLAGITEPGHEGLIKAALTTDMMGVKGEELNLLMEDETGWEAWLVNFRHYHEQWDRHGLMSMARELLLKEKVLNRLMVFPDGERRNTNTLHLIEVLHRISVEKKFNMPRLLKWLSEQRENTLPGREEHQLRLESDENAVKVATIHKCKGLEYPIVFCPFLWDGSRITRSKSPFVFHDQTDDMRLTLDLGSQEMEANRVSAEKELLAENMRLLYVALTRAKNRCTLVWGRINEAETSAPAYLMYPRDSETDGKDIVNATGENFKGLSDEDVHHTLELVQDKAGGAIRLSEIPIVRGRKRTHHTEESPVLESKVFSGDIDRQWHISSFSSLVSAYGQSADLADRDAISSTEDLKEKEPDEAITEAVPESIFAFPKGARAGTFMHDIFEHLDFTDPHVVKDLVTDRLEAYGYDLSWVDSLCEMVQKVVSAPLNPEDPGFQLANIRNKDRINELEFYFPLKPITGKKIEDLFTTYGSHNIPDGYPERIGRMVFSTVKGFMKGFMDMVFNYEDRFYLVDWKSNHLGNRVEDYNQEEVSRAMVEGGYHFQYHIYTVALNMYLKLRLPGFDYQRHFGGVYYIFLRGVDHGRGPQFGIYRHRPSVELVEALCTQLIG